MVATTQDLPNQLNSPELLLIRPAPYPVFFKHNVENAAASLSQWGRGPEQTVRAPPGAHKLLSSDYNYLDEPSRREGGQHGKGGKGAGVAPVTEDGPPPPPLAMQQTRWVGLLFIVEAVAVCHAAGGVGRL